MRKHIAVVATATFIALSGSALAVPVNVSIQSENTGLLPAVNTMINVLPNGGTTPVVQITSGSSSTARSPYEDSAGSIRTGYADQLYTSIQANGAGIWNYAGNTLQFLWGSPDSYNLIQFYSGANGTGTLLGSIIGTDLLQATTGLNHDWVTLLVTSGLFQSIKLSSIGQNAFEFTSLTASCVGEVCRGGGPGDTPVPGAVFLMGSVLAGGAGFGAWRRRRNKVAA